MQLLRQLDRRLLDLAWSLWTELGVAGTKKNHSDSLIWIEELILFTSELSEIDFRLRDESLDWCCYYHHLISSSRLKSLIQDFDVQENFSQYSSTFNQLAKQNWPIFIETAPLNISLSKKSVLRPHASAALLNIRARSVFGTGARADLITFFATHSNSNISIAETSEIGYTKRNLAEVLEDLHFGKLLDRFTQGNQLKYRLNSDSPVFNILRPIPHSAPCWRSIFKIAIVLRKCLKKVENLSESSQVVEIRNCLSLNENELKKVNFTPPIFKNDFSVYLNDFKNWISSIF